MVQVHLGLEELWIIHLTLIFSQG